MCGKHANILVSCLRKSLVLWSPHGYPARHAEKTPPQADVLTDDERRTLEQWARRPTTAQRLALRSRMVLACAEGLTNRAVAKRLRVSSNSVCKWRERFRVRRLPGLTDDPRPGAPRKATDDRLVDVITRTLEGPPPHATQWTTRSMADVAGLSKATIARIWQTFGLQSHRLDTFKLSADPQFVEKVRDIVGLYLCPPDRAIVLVDGRKKSSPSAGPHAAALADAPRYPSAPNP